MENESLKEEIYLKKLPKKFHENLLLRALQIKQEFRRKAPRQQKPFKRTQRKLNLKEKPCHLIRISLFFAAKFFLGKALKNIHKIKTLNERRKFE
jgi:hypothetical protein